MTVYLGFVAVVTKGNLCFIGLCRDDMGIEAEGCISIGDWGSKICGNVGRPSCGECCPNFDKET